MKKKRNKQKMSLWLRFVDFIKKNYVKAIIFITGIIVTLLITKACDRIIPDSPVIVEKIPNTINVVHVYEPLSDTTLTVTNKKTEGVVETAIVKQKRNNTDKDKYDGEKVNKVMTTISFPNAKGYTVQSAAPYFSLEMLHNDSSYIDFVFHFFNKDMLSEIYCLSIKVFKCIGNKKIYVLDENYEKRTDMNVIRLNNIFTSSNYQIELGFVFIKDKDKLYPNFYRQIKFINNSK